MGPLSPGAAGTQPTFLIWQVKHKWADGEIKIYEFQHSGSEVRLEIAAYIVSRRVLLVTAGTLSQVHVSIKEKRNKRAMYYDVTLVVGWEGKSKLARKGYGEMKGMMKLYNIGNDTKFELGGDKETSCVEIAAGIGSRRGGLMISARLSSDGGHSCHRYMFEVGYEPQYHGACEPWATQIKDEAAELFEMISNVIVDKFVPACRAKGDLVK